MCTYSVHAARPADTTRSVVVVVVVDNIILHVRSLVTIRTYVYIEVVGIHVVLLTDYTFFQTIKR